MKVFLMMGLILLWHQQFSGNTVLCIGIEVHYVLAFCLQSNVISYFTCLREIISFWYQSNNFLTITYLSAIWYLKAVPLFNLNEIISLQIDYEKYPNINWYLNTNCKTNNNSLIFTANSNTIILSGKR